MINKVLRWIAQENLIQKKSTVLVGVSGGADSVCLLLLLWRQREKLDIRVEAVHVEHGIRGEESLADADFVRELCEKFHIPLESFSVSVPAYAKEHGMGWEEAARILRYDCYRETAARHIAAGEQVAVALAHHADDNAETMLFQLVRGSGIDGLSGMRAKRELFPGIFLIRPLLSVTRREIEEWLAGQGQPFRTDSTNNDTVYSRNRIRREVVPSLIKVNEQAVSHMGETARELQEISDYLHTQTGILLNYCRVKWKDGVLLRQELTEVPVFLQREVIHTVLAEAAGSSKDWGRIHVAAVHRLFSQQNGRMLSLPYGLAARKVYDGVSIEKKGQAKSTEDGKQAGSRGNTVFCIDFWRALSCLPEGEEMCLALSGQQICMVKISPFLGKMEEIPKNKYTKWFDYDKIKGSLQIRTRKSGDYFMIYDAHGICHKKKLKDYFITEKIPKEQRDSIPLLAEGSHILWILGDRGSEAYRVTGETKRIIEIKMNGDTNEN